MERKRRSRTAKRAPLTTGAGQRIIKGLREAVAGKFARVTIDGQVWVKVEHKKSRAARLREIRTKNTEIKGPFGGVYVARLKIDHQSFTVEGLHDKKHANFYTRMLTIALNRFKYGD